MSIGTIGAGALGSNVARLLAKSGISATIANSHGPESLARLVGELGPNVAKSDSNEFGLTLLAREIFLARHAKEKVGRFVGISSNMVGLAIPG